MSDIDYDLIKSLQSTGMLIRLSTSSFGTQTTDRDKSREVTDSASASDDAARVVVNRLPGPAKARHAQILKTQSAARVLINAMTTPWDESGWRLLMTTRFDECMRQLSVVKQDFDNHLRALQREAPDIMRMAKLALGDLALNVRMPSESDMVAAYAMKTDVVPIPDGANFKGVPDNVREVLAARLEKQIADAYERGVSSIVDRVRPMLANVVERLDAYDERLAKIDAGEDVGRTGAFRDTLVYNLVPIVDLVSALAAVNNDERLTALRDRIAVIVEAKPTELRTDEDVRAKTKEKAREALSLFDDWEFSRIAA